METFKNWLHVDLSSGFLPSGTVKDKINAFILTCYDSWVIFMYQLTAKLLKTINTFHQWMLYLKPKENEEMTLMREMKKRGSENRVYLRAAVLLLLQKMLKFCQWAFWKIVLVLVKCTSVLLKCQFLTIRTVIQNNNMV